ncbi:hypothetical protein DPMN_017166 [Dreissena polymorpha]|uniref:Uncharacterized protein n=1 Tax=Dreissena polymorpha TaxID=45954 RepID=A0A9D4S7W0_DREPO|nr:hypothetical protein DPMN_017166 [Dreissena polymorpha]
MVLALTTIKLKVKNKRIACIYRFKYSRAFKVQKSGKFAAPNIQFFEKRGGKQNKGDDRGQRHLRKRKRADP